MRLRKRIVQLLAAGAILACSGAALAGSDFGQPMLPRHQVPLVEYDNQINNGPMLVWPRGLYNDIGACMKARTQLIGPQGKYINEGSPYAVVCCLGAGGNRCQTAPLGIVP